MPRKYNVPSHLGDWEHAERDIVNTAGQYRGVAADPLGVSPPLGGEINTVPTVGLEAQVDKISELIRWCTENSELPPDVGPSAHGHVHVHVPGLTGSPWHLQRLIGGVHRMQEFMVDRCGQFVRMPDMDGAAVRYLHRDGGRLMPQYMIFNILKMGHSFEDFIRLHAAGKDGVSMGRPFRYAINTYCLKHTKTVEFRMFRGTLNRTYIRNSLLAAEAFLKISLGFADLTAASNFLTDLEFAPMLWDKELWDGLQATKHDEKRGKKIRNYVELEGDLNVS